MTEGSTPACGSFIAALCRKTCGDTRLDASDRHLSVAARTCLARSACTLSALRRPPVGKQRLRRASCRLLEPFLQGDTPVPGQWCAALLSSFTNAPHMSAGAEMDGVPVEADQLGKTQARLGCKQQQGVVAASKPCRPIGHGKYGLDLCARQEMHQPLGVTLARDREDALNKGTAGRFLERHETKKGADSGQAKVACPDAGAALLLEVFEKRVDERRVQIVEHQGRGRLAQPPLCKKEQQPERVPVGCDRVSADI